MTSMLKQVTHMLTHYRPVAAIKEMVQITVITVIIGIVVKIQDLEVGRQVMEADMVAVQIQGMVVLSHVTMRQHLQVQILETNRKKCGSQWRQVIFNGGQETEVDSTRDIKKLFVDITNYYLTTLLALEFNSK